MALELTAEKLVRLCAGIHAVTANSGNILGLLRVHRRRGLCGFHGAERLPGGRAFRGCQSRDEDVVVNEAGGGTLAGKKTKSQVTRQINFAVQAAIARVSDQDSAFWPGDQGRAVIEQVIAAGQRLRRRPGLSGEGGGKLGPDRAGSQHGPAEDRPLWVMALAVVPRSS